MKYQEWREKHLRENPDFAQEYEEYCREMEPKNSSTAQTLVTDFVACS